MKMLIPLLFLLFLAACKDDCGSGDGEPTQNSFRFYMTDAITGQALIGTSSRYHPDTIRVFDAAGLYVAGTARNPFNEQTGHIVGTVDLWADYFNNPTKTTNFYLYLNPFDRDTIKVILTGVEGECNRSMYRYLFNGVEVPKIDAFPGGNVSPDEDKGQVVRDRLHIRK